MSRHPLLGLLMVAAFATPRPAAAQGPEEERALDLRYPRSTGAPMIRVGTVPVQDRLARSIEAAGHTGFIEQGVKASKEALLECQKGDYPGGGMGLMSMPLARPNAVTDHCRRF